MLRFAEDDVCGGGGGGSGDDDLFVGLFFWICVGLVFHLFKFSTDGQFGVVHVLDLDARAHRSQKINIVLGRNVREIHVVFPRGHFPGLRDVQARRDNIAR